MKIFGSMQYSSISSQCDQKLDFLLLIFFIWWEKNVSLIILNFIEYWFFNIYLAVTFYKKIKHLIELTFHLFIFRLNNYKYSWFIDMLVWRAVKFLKDRLLIATKLWNYVYEFTWYFHRLNNKWGLNPESLHS